MKKPRILLFDIETAPLVGYTWGIWEQNVIETKENWYMLSFAAKWYGEKKITVKGLCDYRGYKRDKMNDEKLVRDLYELFEQADFIVGHNVDAFDIKKSNARFIIHGMMPPEPYKTIDTLKMARKHFKFDSNKLDALGDYLGVGRKLPHTGKHLWLGCMVGDMAAWRKMKAYNKQDVVLLERVYEKLRPWATSFPNMNIVTREVDECPRCQSKKLTKRGTLRTLAAMRQRLQCQDCGGWCLSGAVERINSKLMRP